MTLFYFFFVFFHYLGCWPVVWRDRVRITGSGEYRSGVYLQSGRKMAEGLLEDELSPSFRVIFCIWGRSRDRWKRKHDSGNWSFFSIIWFCFWICNLMLHSFLFSRATDISCSCLIFRYLFYYPVLCKWRMYIHCNLNIWNLFFEGKSDGCYIR